MTLLALFPEVWFFLAAMVFFGLAFFNELDSRRLQRLALFLAALGFLISLGAIKGQGLFFSRVYRLDLFSQLFKVLLASGAFLVIFLCRELKGIHRRRHPEFYFLVFMATLALMVLAGGVELLTIYIALELSGYSLYLLVPLRKGEGPHLEAGIKFFLLGLSTSALMLFGLALIYGAAGTTYLEGLLKVLPEKMGSPMVFIGLLFTLGGFFFKLALFPFHFWAPGVYQGAANQVSAFIATSTKVAAIAVLLRIISLFGEGSPPLTRILAVLSIASMTLGNLTAIVQKDLKRLLAYSAVAHAGYVLIGLLSLNEEGQAGAVFYALAYLVMNFTCFLVLIKTSPEGDNLEIEGLAGLHRRSPLLALALMLGLFSLGGIPPTIGFTAKFLVFVPAMGQGHFLLVLIAMINVVVSLYYYAMVLKAAYFLRPAEDLPLIILSRPAGFLVLVLMVIIVGGGLFPQLFYEVARTAVGFLR